MGARYEYKDYYTILGVPRSAAADDIKARYRQLAVELHPDKNSSRAAIERFKAVSEAYQILSDPMSKEAIDKHLDERIHRRRLSGESFIDRFAGIRRRPSRARPPPFMRFMEIALAPRVLLAAAGLTFCGFLLFGPKDETSGSGDMMLVPAWFNPKTNRWETPAPWNEDYYKNASTHRLVDRYLVFESAPPQAVVKPSPFPPSASNTSQSTN